MAEGKLEKNYINCQEVLHQRYFPYFIFVSLKLCGFAKKKSSAENNGHKSIISGKEKRSEK